MKDERLKSMTEAELFTALSGVMGAIKRYSREVFMAKLPTLRRLKQMKRENAEEWQAAILDRIEELNSTTTYEELAARGDNDTLLTPTP